MGPLSYGEIGEMREKVLSSRRDHHEAMKKSRFPYLGNLHEIRISQDLSKE